LNRLGDSVEFSKYTSNFEDINIGGFIDYVTLSLQTSKFQLEYSPPEELPEDIEDSEVKLERSNRVQSLGLGDLRALQNFKLQVRANPSLCNLKLKHSDTMLGGCIEL